MTEKKPARPKKKASPKPKLTDAERHKRFIAMAREVEADESPGALEKAFDRIVSAHITALDPRNDPKKM
jgi:hypothetical protein